jgi:hypothetical protein
MRDGASAACHSNRTLYKCQSSFNIEPAQVRHLHWYHTFDTECDDARWSALDMLSQEHSAEGHVDEVHDDGVSPGLLSGAGGYSTAMAAGARA